MRIATAVILGQPRADGYSCQISTGKLIPVVYVQTEKEGTVSEASSHIIKENLISIPVFLSKIAS